VFMVNERLKSIIFKKLYDDLSHLEIIHHDNEIWFIDRKDRRWYLIFNPNGTLWWRYGCFTSLLSIFSLMSKDFSLFISSWVEEVINTRIHTTHVAPVGLPNVMEEVLKHKVGTTVKWLGHPVIDINKVLKGNDVTQL